MKPGRNDPCPCGSGKKYKKCCLLAERPVDGDLMPRILGRCSDMAAEALMQHAREMCGRDVLTRAWMEFWGTEDVLEAAWPRDSPYMPLFVCWMLYHWIPWKEDDVDLEPGVPSERTVASSCVRHEGWRVDEPTRRFIDSARRAPLSFWQAGTVEPGKGFLLRDMATEQERFVHERAASKTVAPWDILFGQVVEVDGVCILNGMGPYTLPPLRFRHTVEQRLTSWRAGDGSGAADGAWLLGRDADCIRLYLECVDEILHPTMPDVRNTDGDRLEWTTSTYRFDAQQRGRILGRLDSMRNIEGTTEEAPGGEYVWISQRQDTAVPGAHKARIEVQDDRLVTECNSRRRDRALRARLLKSMDALITHEDTAYQSLDMAEIGSQRDAAPDSSGPLHLQQLPEEARAAVTQHMDETHLSWADRTVPALGGKTPREAVTTEEGRRQVELLINDFENTQLRGPDSPSYRFDYNRLRHSLGLPEA